LLVVVHSSLGITVSWDGRHMAEVSADVSWKGQLCGLCGDYNNDPSDDFRSSNGTLMSTASDYGNTFLVGEFPECSCREGNELEPCIKAGGDLEVRARTQCSILKGDVFKPAHVIVDPNPYFSACLYDVCACPANEKCLCDILGMYAHEARKKGVVINWRSTDLCSKYFVNFFFGIVLTNQKMKILEK
ncbi:kielin/chordin-like protein, partial [Anneissia japonica]|uniref:kielin/chordin-like protein n=1 Tax=Anneissia japonica TaxID=1529436 RepID=UPI0014257BDC